jgi:hypothetical protein
VAGDVGGVGMVVVGVVVGVGVMGVVVGMGVVKFGMVGVVFDVGVVGMVGVVAGGVFFGAEGGVVRAKDSEDEVASDAVAAVATDERVGDSEVADEEERGGSAAKSALCMTGPRRSSGSAARMSIRSISSTSPQSAMSVAGSLGCWSCMVEKQRNHQ